MYIYATINYDRTVMITFLELGAALGIVLVPRLNTEMKLWRQAKLECIAQFFINNTALCDRPAK